MPGGTLLLITATCSTSQTENRAHFGVSKCIVQINELVFFIDFGFDALPGDPNDALGDDVAGPCETILNYLHNINKSNNSDIKTVQYVG